MTEKVFLTVLNMSITAAWVIVFIMILRFMLRRLPAQYSYILWAAAGFRLLCPFSVSSAFSLFNMKNFNAVHTGKQMEYIPADIGYAMQPEINLGAAAVSEAVNGSLPAGNAAASVNPLQIWIFFGCWVWILGMAVFLAVSVISLLRTKRMVSRATLLQDQVYECENISSPFVMGIFGTKIYIPYRLGNHEREYILAHEHYHIRRRDPLVKLLAFGLLILHWFNPFVWIAWRLMCKDMETSCDEAVIGSLGLEERKKYGALLLSFGTNHRHFSPGPLAFGESDTAHRIKNVLRFQNPKAWMSVLGICAVAVIAAACMTNGKTEEPNAVMQEVPAESVPEIQESQAEDETAGKQEFQAVNDSMVKDQLQRWAVAFCERDTETLLEMSSDEVEADFRERELLAGGGADSVSFGMSSPWPWQAGADYRIMAPADNTAEILYYAQTSDPHVIVWRETLEFQVLEEGILIESENLRYMDYICSMEEFLLAYPYGINGTEMDYLANGMGEALNNNAILSSSTYYKDLFQPDRAVIRLLNLLDNFNKVEIRQHLSNPDGSVAVQIRFAEDNSFVHLLMVQPYGEAGIWIPQDLPALEAAEQHAKAYSNYRAYEEVLER